MIKINENILLECKKILSLHSLFRKTTTHRDEKLKIKSKNIKRAFSSAGSEHLPYKQRVGGSNPSTPTKLKHLLIHFDECFFLNIFKVIIPVYYIILSNKQWIEVANYCISYSVIMKIPLTRFSYFLSKITRISPKTINDKNFRKQI